MLTVHTVVLVLKMRLLLYHDIIATYKCMYLLEDFDATF